MDWDKLLRIDDTIRMSSLVIIWLLYVISLVMVTLENFGAHTTFKFMNEMDFG